MEKKIRFGFQNMDLHGIGPVGGLFGYSVYFFDGDTIAANKLNQKETRIVFAMKNIVGRMLQSMYGSCLQSSLFDRLPEGLQKKIKNLDDREKETCTTWVLFGLNYFKKKSLSHLKIF